MQSGTGSQWRTSRRSGVMWSYFLLLPMSLAAELSTDWSPSRRHAGAPASRLLQRSTLEVTKAAGRPHRPPRQRLDAAPDETELAKATAYCPRNMAPHGQDRLQQETEVMHRGQGPYQGTADTQLTGVKIDAPSTGRTPQEVRLL